jgi:hypothetical protein
MSPTVCNNWLTLNAPRPVTVLGAAVIDVIADAYALPWRGCDIELQTARRQCWRLRAEHRRALNGWGSTHKMRCRLARACGRKLSASAWQRGANSVIRQADGDNGWCLALVEPDGERTFMSFSGVENQWNAAWLERCMSRRQPGLSFRLSAGIPSGELLVSWLERLPR